MSESILQVENLSKYFGGLAAVSNCSLKIKKAVSYTHLRAHETSQDLVCRLLLEKKKKN